MVGTLLGCPHCGRPVGSAPHVVGRAVGCPYCRRPFQMPGQPAANPAASAAKPEPPAPEARVSDPRAAVRRWATVFAWAATGGCVVGAMLVIVAVVGPQWRNAAGEFAVTLRGVLSLGAVVLFAVAAGALCFLVRACVLVALSTIALRLRVSEPSRGG
jgi:hypothetical protein